MNRREECAVCGAGGLIPILATPPYPVYQGCVGFARGDDETAPMAWSACAACGSAQIVSLPPLERIYQAGHATGLGAAWARHHAAFAAFVQAHATGAIVDVGGGSGTLALAYKRGGGDAPWTILEPNALRAAGLPADVNVVDGFLGDAALQAIGANSVVMSHVLEHVIDLKDALRVLRDAAACRTVLLAWPELEAWTAKGQAGALNFEHNLYVSAPRLEAAFGAAGWRLHARRRWDENDTLFLCFVRGDGRTDAPPSDPSAPIARYYAGFRAQAKALDDALARHDGDAFLMPASVYAQTLIAEGLQEGRFKALLDNAAVKQGRRLYGTGLTVAAPEAALAAARRPLIVLNGGAHEAEIAENLHALHRDAVILRSDATPI
ncbi:MAG: methyltransferase domain-containing protein [Rhizomicrobium sp.]